MNYAPLLALFVRSLREDARSRATYWARAGLGCFLLVVMFLFSAGNSWSNAPGRTFFTAVISFQIAAITLMGLSYFASAVAEEKEEQTLGLLRMTDLSPLSILLGKSTSRLWGALCLLAAQFPFTIIAVTFGGISLGQVVASYCAVGAFTFLLCNLALLGSVIARGVAGAAAFSIVVIALILSFVPLLFSLQWTDTHYLHWGVPFDRVGSAIWAATPIARLSEVLGTGYKGGIFGWQVWTNVAFGLVCFLLAWAAFQRFCDREPEAVRAAPRPVSRPAPGALDTAGTRRRKGRPPRAWDRALVWKDFHFLCGGRMGFFVRVISYGLILAGNIWVLTFFYDEPARYGLGRIFFQLVPLIFSVDIAVMAARMFRTELRDQTLSVLAVLPQSMRDIVHGKICACLLAALPGFICTVAVQLHFLFAVSYGSTKAGLMAALAKMHLLLLVQTVGGWCNKLLLVVLIAWLSLSMKRGALPAGYLLTYVGNSLVSIIIWMGIGMLTSVFTGGGGFSFTELLPIVSGVLSLGVAWVFYRGGIYRLQTLAGED